jgi:hypothetical protein
LAPERDGSKKILSCEWAVKGEIDLVHPQFSVTMIARQERILSGASSVFPQRKAGSKACRETSVEARLL